VRVLTTLAQVYRVALLDGGDGDYPLYPYNHKPIPATVGRMLVASLTDVFWPADRDFLNEDGGFIVVYDDTEEFELPPFGMPPVDVLEDVRCVHCDDGSVWWWCLAIANNETTIDYVFSEDLAPATLIEQLRVLASAPPPPTPI
jgi:hypothetical protein